MKKKLVVSVIGDPVIRVLLKKGSRVRKGVLISKTDRQGIERGEVPCVFV